MKAEAVEAKPQTVAVYEHEKTKRPKANKNESYE
jgi:hypothetical protein